MKEPTTYIQVIECRAIRIDSPADFPFGSGAIVHPQVDGWDLNGKLGHWGDYLCESDLEAKPYIVYAPRFEAKWTKKDFTAGCC